MLFAQMSLCANVTQPSWDTMILQYALFANLMQNERERMGNIVNDSYDPFLFTIYARMVIE